jgi:hypothetical protein
MRFIHWLAICIVFVSCTKERSTNYVATLYNGSSHNIEIKPYYGGVSPANKKINLGPMESKEIANGFDRGIVDHAGFSSAFLGSPDSMVVIFNNAFSITHYTVTPTVFSNKYYLYTSLRNIENYKSYEYKILEDSKHERGVSYKYTFTNQDYLDAQ